MKCACVALAALTWCSITPAQEAPPAEAEAPRTKLETLENRSETVVIKGFSFVGRMSGGKVGGGGPLVVAVREARDAASGERESGLVIWIGDERRPETQAFVDHDELEPLIEALKFLETTTKSVTRLDSYEASYRTRDDLDVSLLETRNGQRLAVEVGRPTRTRILLAPEQLKELRGLIEKGRDKLDGTRDEAAPEDQPSGGEGG